MMSVKGNMEMPMHGDIVLMFLITLLFLQSLMAQ
jgi:hypothetical protein